MLTFVSCTRWLHATSADLVSTHRAGEPHKYYTMRAAAAHIVEREGIRALFRGSLVNILRGCAGALTLTLYDGLKDWLLQVEKKTGMQTPS